MMMDEKLSLTTDDLREANVMNFDNAGRAYPHGGTAYSAYICANSYRPPSRAYPYTYMKPLLTRKFAKWLSLNAPLEAMARGLRGVIHVSSTSLTLAEITVLTGVTKSTIYDWIARRGFPKAKSVLDRPVLWDGDAVNRWWRENKSAAWMRQRGKR